MTPTRLHLVRHGHVENPERKVYGRLPGWKLSAAGRRQAKDAAEHLRGCPIVHVYSSPLERAADTAAAIGAASGVPVTVHEDLTESELGAFWEGLSWAEVKTTRRVQWEAYLQRPHEVDFLSETFPALGERMAAALRAIAARHGGREVAVVTHGDPIKAAVCHLTGEPISAMHRLRVPTGSLVTVDIGPGGARVVERWTPPGAPSRQQP